MLLFTLMSPLDKQPAGSDNFHISKVPYPEPQVIPIGSIQLKGITDIKYSVVEWKSPDGRTQQSEPMSPAMAKAYRIHLKISGISDDEIKLIHQTEQIFPSGDKDPGLTPPPEQNDTSS